MSQSVRKLTFLISIPAAVFMAAACSATGPGGPAGEGNGSGTGGGNSDIQIGTGGSTGDGDIIVDPNQNLPPTPNCADGVLNDDEVCDDGNKVDGDGCYANCRGIEQGFLCPKAGEACIAFAVCGDGVAAFPEQCDDGNAAPGDGCSDNCKIEIGFKCPMQNAPCSATTCGDGIVEGAEMCEPSLVEGCTAQCQFAPNCDGNGACTSECGDGLVLGEDCDDGNLLSGDGCDENCLVEGGYMCTDEQSECETSPHTSECILRAPTVFRDFSTSHSDFESCTGTTAATGLVQTTLTGGKPVATGSTNCMTNFSQWYQNDPASTAFTTFNGEIILYDDGAGNFVNRHGSSGEKWETEAGGGRTPGLYDGSPFFYPVDGIPGAKDDGGTLAQISTTEYGMTGAVLNDPSGVPRNFAFTSEVSYWFTYEADTNATLKFVGDDDLWVFVNGVLALDLGGVHQALPGEFTVNGGNSNIVGGTSAAHNMTIGNVYEIKVFHAERHTTGSSFKLTLSGFNTSRSDCRATCGDGIVAFGEQCDDGVNDGGYNECQSGCVLGGYCGDGLVQEGEVCDDNAPDAPSGCIGCRIPIVR